MTHQISKPLQFQSQCIHKCDDPDSLPKQFVLVVDPSSNTNKQKRWPKIILPLRPAICLWLLELATALLLMIPSGDLGQFQWLLLATLIGSFLNSIVIEFSGIFSCHHSNVTCDLRGK